ncbi:ABC transporter substrate-binding protein [Ruminococcaceae bacterium OttesenSCG-928-O06]|nr:ABC transporter substrate-binding protein [Ruminococcaceae bacterium OttesenSCG-928-O06]
MKVRKLAAALLALAICALPLAGCGGTGAQGVEVEPGYDYERFADAGITLNVYNWGEYISDGTDGESMDVNAEFEALTGIKVNYTTFDTNEAMYAKLKSGGASYDVIIPSDYMIGKMASEDMLAPLDFANIPNFELIGEEYKNQAYDPDNLYSVPYTWGYVGIIYNTTMVDDVVDSWDILWDEKYAGDVLMFDNSRDAFAIALKRMGESMNPTTTSQIDHAAVELSAQRRVVQAYVMDQIFDKMEGGEAALAPYYAGDAITMIEENPDLAFAVPKEGTNYFVDAMCVPAGSANKEAAEMYINFMCETAVAVENCLAIGYSTPQVRAEVALPDDVKNNPIAYPPVEVLDNTETFTVLSDELNAYMDKAWSDMRAAPQ